MANKNERHITVRVINQDSYIWYLLSLFRIRVIKRKIMNMM